ncbi:MAG: hypothetical protein AB1635_05180 [Acidobacteriota bacterium]
MRIRAGWWLLAVATVVAVPFEGRAQSGGALESYVFAGGGAFERQHVVAGHGRVAERGTMPLVGAGAEWRPMARVGLAADLAAAGYDSRPLPALGVAVHAYLSDPARPGRALTPFITAGYSLLADTEPKIDVGGGVRARLGGQIGLRLEVRHRFTPRREPRPGAFTAVTEGRVAVTFARRPATRVAAHPPGAGGRDGVWDGLAKGALAGAALGAAAGALWLHGTGNYGAKPPAYHAQFTTGVATTGAIIGAVVGWHLDRTR